MARTDIKEITIPLSLLGAGVALLFVAALHLQEAASFPAIMLGLAIDTTIRVTLLIVVAFLTARLIGAGFGSLNTAILKFAAIVVFTSGLTQAVNLSWIGWAIAIICWFCLLIYLFDLDGKEALIFIGVMIFVNVIISFAIAGMGLAARS